MPLNGQPLDAPVPIAQLLRAGLARDPDGVAIASTAARCSRRDLDRASDNLAGNYRELGLKPGDRVASLMPNRVALIIHYLACMKSGLVGVPLNYRYTTPEIDRALAVSGASMLIAHAERERDVGASHQVRELPRGLVYAEADDGRRASLLQLMDTTLGSKEFPISKSSDPAFIFFTSGSTGAAKGVTHSREGIGWMFAGYAAAHALTPGDVVLAAGSISHIAAFGFSFGALAAGARAIIAHSLDSRHILQLLREQRPTVFWMQPALLFQLVRDPGASPEDFQSLRLCRCGSDKVPAELRREFTELTGLAISEILGMTEVGTVAANPASGPVKAGSIGQPAPGVRISICDDDGRELPPGAEGRMLISTRSLTIGYWADPAATAAVIRDGWLDSGDIVKADEEGYITFRGRKKQLIVHDGSNISPQEVEDALLLHPAVAMAGVVGVRDLVHGENVFAYVTLKTDKSAPSEQELIQFAHARVGYKAPERVEFLAEMPINSGKIDRTTLRKLAAERDTAQAR